MIPNPFWTSSTALIKTINFENFKLNMSNNEKQKEWSQKSAREKNQKFISS